MTDYGALSVEELERRFRETFFYTDRIDETVFLELVRLRKALEEKQGADLSPSAEEFWERFLRDRGGELERCFASPEGTGTAGNQRRRGTPLRTALIAAVIVVLLAGAALAAGPLGLWAWVPKWNAAAGRYEPAAQEISGDSPIPAALRELGITEPVFPTHMPKGFVITETHISEEPLILVEQYARGNQHISITITPIKGFINIVYQKEGEAVREYQSGTDIHYILSSERNITAIWYTKNYATTISGDISLDDIKKIIDSIYEESK